MADALPVTVFERHNTCLACGYDLFGQPRNGVCPKCGASVRETSSADLFLGVPGNVARMKSGSLLLLISSCMCGLCPGVCLLYLANNHIVVAMLMTLVFAATAVTATVGELRLTEILAHTDDAFEGFRFRMSDGVAGLGLTLVNASAYLYLSENGYSGGHPALSLLLLGGGFLLLAVTAWRVAESGRRQARVAEAALGGRASGLGGLGIFKSFYETIWLASCFLTIVMMAADNEAAAFLGFVALFGLMGFAVVWLFMIVLHAILFARVCKHAGRPLSYGFEVIPTAAAIE